MTVERPLRIEGIDPNRSYKAAEIRKTESKREAERHGGGRDQKDPQTEEQKPTRCMACSATTVNGRSAVVEYEPDTDLRDTEQIPLLEEGGIDGFLSREVLPYADDAWCQPNKVKIGYEISFNRHFYKPKPMRTLGEIRADIMALEQETEGLLAEILGGVKS